MTTAQGRQHNKKKGKYADRYNITERNKVRKAKKRAKKWAKLSDPVRVDRIKSARLLRQLVRRDARKAKALPRKQQTEAVVSEVTV